MSIQEQLREGYDNVRRYCLNPPDVIYAGEHEYAEIERLIKEFSVFKDPRFPSNHHKWNGIPVYKVDTKFHLRFGVIFKEDPSPCG